MHFYSFSFIWTIELNKLYAFIYVLQYIDHITQISESNVNIPTLPVYKTFNVFIYFFFIISFIVEMFY